MNHSPQKRICCPEMSQEMHYMNGAMRNSKTLFMPCRAAKYSRRFGGKKNSSEITSPCASWTSKTCGLVSQIWRNQTWLNGLPLLLGVYGTKEMPQECTHLPFRFICYSRTCARDYLNTDQHKNLPFLCLGPQVQLAGTRPRLHSTKLIMMELCSRKFGRQESV